MTIKSFAVLSLLTAGLGITAFSQNRFDLKVRNYFFAGFSGDAESLATGMKLSEEALAADPKNAEAMVWHGAGLYFQAGQAFQKGDQQTGQDLYQRGMKKMDDAVALAPDQVGVRIPRGASLFTASRFVPPEMAKPLIEKAVSDYAKAYEVQEPSLDKLGQHPKGELLLGLADGYGRLGDEDKAKQFYGMVLKEMPGTPYAKKATAWMETKASQTGCIGCHTTK